MQIETSIDAIERRAKAVGLTLTALAKAAGMPASTILRHKNQTSARLDTLGRINTALEAEERRVLAHLMALHPDMVPCSGAPPVPGMPPAVLNGRPQPAGGAPLNGRAA